MGGYLVNGVGRQRLFFKRIRMWTGLRKCNKRKVSDSFHFVISVCDISMTFDGYI